MDVDCPVARGRRRQPQLDVREDQADVWKPTRYLVVEDRLVLVDAEVVGDAQRLDPGFGLLEPREVLVPCVLAELIVHRRTGRMDVRIPAPPDRPPRVRLRLHRTTSRNWPRLEVKRLGLPGSGCCIEEVITR